MKKQILLVAVSVLALTTTANAGYITGSLGYSSLGDFTLKSNTASFNLEGDSNFKLSGGYGFELAPNWKGEATLSKSSYDFSFQGTEVGEVDMTAIEFNALYNFKQKDSKFTPYIGGGLGFTKIELGIDSLSWDDTVLTLQLKGGVSYKLDGKGLVFAELTSKGFAKADFEGDTIDDFGSFDVSIGYRYNF